MVVKEAIAYGSSRFADAGIADAKTDSFLFLEAAAGIDRTEYLLHPERSLTEEEEQRFREWVERRCQHEPAQYILGMTEFYGLPFYVNRNVLIPRQDTEILVEEALKRLPEGGALLDLCTGSGAIAVALKHTRADVSVTAIDISDDALEVAKRNAEDNHCKIDFIRSDLFDALNDGEAFDVIASNPPYVSDSEYEVLMPEVKEHEPSLALKAGEKGLAIYERLVWEAPSYLKEEGVLLVEIGCSQAEDVKKLFQKAGFHHIKVVKDLAGLDRVVLGNLK